MITKDENNKLNVFPTDEEVKKVVFELNRDSTSDPDGLTGNFYQTCWNIVARDIIEVVHTFFRGVHYQSPLLTLIWYCCPKRAHSDLFIHEAN